MDNCRICDIVTGKYLFQEVDKPLLENEHFFAIASIGAFIEGWTLILPKNHCYSMRHFFEDPQFKALLVPILDALRAEYGQLILFEHGANSCDSKTSCGTHHAHLHIVPYSSLEHELRASPLEWIETASAELSSIPDDKEYLFYAEVSDGEHYSLNSGQLHILQTPISQFFRRLLARLENKPEMADYKEFHFLENAEATHRRLISRCFLTANS